MHYKFEHRCSFKTKKGTPCKGWSRYTNGKVIGCGTHIKTNRKDLPDNPRHDLYIKKQKDMHMITVKKGLNDNKEQKCKGNIILTQIQIRKRPEYTPEYYPIFPNVKNSLVMFGWIEKSLSPMYMDKVFHLLPGTPVASCVENL